MEDDLVKFAGFFFYSVISMYIKKQKKVYYGYCGHPYVQINHLTKKPRAPCENHIILNYEENLFGKKANKKKEQEEEEKELC